MMRELMLERMSLILAGATVGQMRWQSFGRCVFVDVLHKDPDTKVGKRELKALELDKVDYSVLSDNGLLIAFEHVIRQYSQQF